MTEVVLVLLATRVVPILLASYIIFRYLRITRLLNDWQYVKNELDLDLLYEDVESTMLELAEEIGKHLANRPKVPWYFPWLK